MDEILMLRAIDGINDNELEDIVVSNLLQSNVATQVNRAERHGRLNLDQSTEEETLKYFRFKKEDIRRLTAALGILEFIVSVDRHTVNAMEGLCIFLRRLAYPNRLSDLETLFGFSAQTLSYVCKSLMDLINDNWGDLLRNLDNLQWLNHDKLQQYAQAIRAKGAPLNNCWGFIDGTARPICRPSMDQENYFSGHKRHHCVKYQSVLCPDGIVANLTPAYPGRRHDAGIFRESGVYAQLEKCATFPNGENFVLYGDQDYGIRRLLISPYANRPLTDGQQIFNTAMSSVRQFVEWGFSKIVGEFAFLDSKKNQKLLLQDISSMYSAGVILTNCHTCLYSCQTAQYFNVIPPNLEEYLN